MMAACLRNDETGDPYFPSMEEGAELLMRRPIGLISAIGTAVAIANRQMEPDANPES